MPHFFPVLSFLRRFVAIVLLSLLAACSLPQVQAQDRLFLDLSLEFLDEYQLPEIAFEETPVGGLSALTYDRAGDRFYAISDDRGNLAPSRFYTLRVALNDENGDGIRMGSVSIEDVTTLKNQDGKPYPAGSIDPEGIALTAQGTVAISSEGDSSAAIAPFVGEYDLATGQLQQLYPLPPYYAPDKAGELQTMGVQNNLGFEALTLNFGGTMVPGEPFRVFAATESALLQDVENIDESADATPERAKVRLLHYLVTGGRPQILAEHLYRLEPPPFLAVNGLTELISIDGGGHFLSLERSFGVGGNGAKIFQLALGDANDIAGYETLKGDISGVRSIRKQLVLDLGELDMTLDNLEGMTLGPKLPDGSQSLLLVSDDNFSEEQVTQFLLFRLKNN